MQRCDPSHGPIFTGVSGWPPLSTGFTRSAIALFYEIILSIVCNTRSVASGKDIFLCIDK
jgi:hypothetical protein